MLNLLLKICYRNDKEARICAAISFNVPVFQRSNKMNKAQAKLRIIIKALSACPLDTFILWTTYIPPILAVFVFYTAARQLKFSRMDHPTS